MQQSPRGIAIAFVVSLIGLGTVTACPPPYYAEVGNGGGLVGGACDDEDDCAERCLKGKPYPSGTCTLDCDDDRDCPEDSWCIDRDGGVCLLECDVDDHCRSGYGCKEQDRRNEDGDVEVCIH
ncbi:MAG TPA: hypothetical protein VFG69_14880 [Nannocystaceae bacterium]|nr:hypothetical protein [Nannocystaceae bacterium]